jgi:hypothetical protein
MKANELRIGNWYEHNGIPTQVTSNTIEEVWEAERIWCKAVPLTEEWLLKFGFEKSEIGFSQLERVIYQIEGFDFFVTQFGNNYVLGHFNNEECSSISYFCHGMFNNVHQLQNLYFALTGEELTYGGNK